MPLPEKMTSSFLEQFLTFKRLNGLPEMKKKNINFDQFPFIKYYFGHDISKKMLMFQKR